MKCSPAVQTSAKQHVGSDFLMAGDQALLRLGQVLRQADYRFTTVTPATHERVNARPENGLARDLAGVLGWSRRFDPSVLTKHVFDLMCTAGIVVPDGDGYRSLLRLSNLGDNLYFHSAYPTDESDAVFFGPDTYRFIGALKHSLSTRRISVNRAVDIGCGAGPGAVFLAQAYPHAEVVAVDVNDCALYLTRINADLANVDNISTAQSDLLRQVEGSFDLIVANPPYLVDASKRAYRHGGGIYGWDLSLAIIETALERLASGGTLILYSGSAIVHGGDPFRVAITKLLERQNVAWAYVETDPDIFGEELLTQAYDRVDRIAAIVLTVTKQ